MWFRFLWVSLVGWVLNLLLVLLVLRFLLPQTLPGLVLAILPWLISFIVAFIAGDWAFSSVIPGRQETVMFSIIWLVIGFTLFLVYGSFFLGDIRYITNSPDMYVTFVTEILGICLASFVTRRRKIKETLGEGLAE